jgi:hypothetical protein
VNPRQLVAAEEARHAVAMVAYGWEVIHVTARRDGDPHRLGYTQGLKPAKDIGEADRMAEEHLVVRLVGKIGEPGRAWPPPFDEALHTTAEGLGETMRERAITATAYRRACFMAAELLERPEIAAAVELVTQALLEVEHLDGADLAQLLG